MKTNAQIVETLKMAGGALVIAAAFAVMLPGFAGYAFSLWRIGLLVIVTVLIAGGLTLGVVKLSMKNKSKSKVPQEQDKGAIGYAANEEHSDGIS